MKKYLIAILAIFLFKSSHEQVITLYTGEVSIINQVTVYENPNFTGQSKSFAEGTYRFFGPRDLNDLISSIKVPAGFAAIIYEYANDAGGYGDFIDLLEDCADLSKYKFNDRLSYLTVLNVSSRPGFTWARNKMVNGQVVAGHWERKRASGGPDNTPPAIMSTLAATPVNDVVQPNLTNLPAFEDIAVFRLQLRITTGVGADAGTDNPVYTQLNNKDPRFYLVKGVDNFVEGRALTYDVLSTNIRTIRDIEFLRFGIKGDDGVCIKKVDIILNNHRAPVFTKIFNDEKGYCIDNGSSSLLPMIEISGYELRNSPLWRLITTNPSNIPLCWAPTSISREWLTSLVEASIGDKLQSTNGNLKWGTDGNLWGAAVESKMLNDHTIQFDLDLSVDVIGPDPELDVDFEYDFHCINGVLSVDLQNSKNSLSTYGSVRYHVLTFMENMGVGPASFFITDFLNRRAWTLSADGKEVKGACSNIFIDNEGNVRLR